MSKLNQKKTFFHGATRFCLCALMAGAFLLSLQSCTENQKESLEDLKFEISQLESSIKWLVEDSKTLRDNYQELSEKVSLLEFKDESKATAFFCVSKGISDGVQVMESSSESFLISLKEITPYLSGYKLRFSIGNTSSATYNNAKLKVNWNRSYQNWKNDKEYASKIKEYESTLDEYWKKSRTPEFSSLKKPEKPKRAFWFEEKKEKEFTLKNPLNPGSWNYIEVHVTPATLEQLDSVVVSIETSAISLIQEQDSKS